MKSFSDVASDFQSSFKNSKEIAAGIAKVTPYLAVLACGVATGGAGLTLATIVVLAAGAVEGAAGILAVLSEPSKKFKNLPAHERFDVSFHLLCQQAYAAAVHKHLPSLGEQALKNAIKLEAIEDPGGGDPREAGTTWTFEVDFLRMPIPLFSACGRRLLFLIRANCVRDDVAKQLVGTIDQAARKMLDVFLSTKQEPYEWLYDYTQLHVLRRVRAATDSLPQNIAAAIREAAGEFLETPRTAGGAKKAWAEYRTLLQSETSREIFGSDVSIGQLYVLPNFTYYRQGARAETHEQTEKKAEAAVRGNLAPFLTQLISTRTPRNNLIFLFGDPGVGKTSFAKMYADALSQYESFHPVYIPLQYIDPTQDLVPEIEKYLQSSPLRAALPDLAKCSNVVFILDAFDELAQATRDRMGDFFRRLERFSSDQLYRNAAVIATGRDTLFSHGDTLIPNGTHVVTLQSFDKSQIAEWSQKWNTLTKQAFDGTRFWQEDKNKRNDLHDLATQPLLLYLLARLERARKPVDPAQTGTSRAAVYRQLLQWVCDRQQEKTPGKSMSAGQMRKLLRLTGFASASRGKRAVHLTDLQNLLQSAGLSEEIVQKSENYQAERTFLTFSFAKTGQAAWEFKHKQFGEYLAAEYVAEQLDQATKQNPDPDEPNEKRFVLSSEGFVKMWVDLFARLPISAELEGFLESMVGGWSDFLQGVETGSAEKQASYRRLLKRCGQTFGRLIRDEDMRTVLDASVASGIETFRVVSNCLVAVFSIARLCARLQSVYFNPQEYAPNGILKALHIMRSYDGIDHLLGSRLFTRVNLDGANGLSLPYDYYPGLFLPFMRITKISNADGHPFEQGLSAPGALLFAADLSGIVLPKVRIPGGDISYANLKGADLRGADLKGARLIYTNFEGANLEGADLRGAILYETNFTKCNLAKARFTGAQFSDTKFVDAVLHNATDLPLLTNGLARRRVEELFDTGPE